MCRSKHWEMEMGERGGQRLSAVLCPRRIALLSLLLSLTFLTGCSSAFRQSNFIARESYSSVNLNSGFQEGIALLTATGGRDGIDFNKLLVEITENALREERSDIKLIPYWLTLSNINREGLTEEYASMLKDYSSTGILNKGVLEKIKGATGVRYFLQPRLVTYARYQHGRFNFLGLSLIKTHESLVKIYLELWNAETGEILWIGVTDTNVAEEHYKAKPIPFEDVARVAIRELIKKMPKEVVE